MKKKKLIFIFIAFLLVVYLIIFYNDYLTGAAQEGRKNAENINKVKIGMDTTEVLKIMGKPYERYNNERKEIFYNYIPHPSSSTSIQVIFDSTGRVIYK